MVALSVFLSLSHFRISMLASAKSNHLSPIMQLFLPVTIASCLPCFKAGTETLQHNATLMCSCARLQRTSGRRGDSCSPWAWEVSLGMKWEGASTFTCDCNGWGTWGQCAALQSLSLSLSWQERASTV